MTFLRHLSQYQSQLFQGFFTDNKNRTIITCLEAVLQESYAKPALNRANTVPANNSVDENPFSTVNNVNSRNKEADPLEVVYKIEAQMACLHRLFASKIGFQAFTAVSG